MSNSPNPMRHARMKFSSNRGPRMTPRSIATTGYRCFFITYPSTPNTTITPMSNTYPLRAKPPSRQKTETIGTM